MSVAVIASVSEAIHRRSAPDFPVVNRVVAALVAMTANCEGRLARVLWLVATVSVGKGPRGTGGTKPELDPATRPEGRLPRLGGESDISLPKIQKS